MSKSYFFMALPLLLCSCVPPNQIPTDGSNVGLTIEHGNTSATTKDVTEEAEEDIDINALKKSYDDAVVVRDIMLQISMNMDEKSKHAMAPALQAFSDDVDALRYYAEISTFEDLSETENTTVALLSANIEEAMTVFSKILELSL